MHRNFPFTCHIHPALDSRLRGNDGLMWEREVLVGAIPRPTLRRIFAASSWCQGVQLGASPSMMETTLMMCLPL